MYRRNYPYQRHNSNMNGLFAFTVPRPDTEATGTAPIVTETIPYHYTGIVIAGPLSGGWRSNCRCSGTIPSANSFIFGLERACMDHTPERTRGLANIPTTGGTVSTRITFSFGKQSVFACSCAKKIAAKMFGGLLPAIKTSDGWQTGNQLVS